MAFHRDFVLEEEKEKHIENAYPRPTVESFKFGGGGDNLVECWIFVYSWVNNFVDGFLFISNTM